MKLGHHQKRALAIGTSKYGLSAIEAGTIWKRDAESSIKTLVFCGLLEKVDFKTYKTTYKGLEVLKQNTK